MADINISKKKKKKKNKLLTITVVLSLFVGALIIWGYARYAPSYETKVVQEGEIKNLITAKGIAVCQEELLSSDKKGIPIINYADGTRVVARTHIATLYTSDVDEGKSAQISELNEKINYLETNKKNLQKKEEETKDSLNDTLIAKMNDIAYYSNEGNLEGLQREHSEIQNIITTSNTEDLSGQLEELKEKRDELEMSITGDKTEYISKSAGVVYSSLDGYETTLTKDSLKDVTASTFKTLWNSKPIDYEKTEPYIYGKVINNFEAQIIACIDSDDAEGIKEGAVYGISLSKSASSTIPATVDSIKAEKNQTIIVFTVMRNVEDFISERKFEFTIVKSKYNGLSVPTEAIFEENGENVVWVIKDSAITKKKVEILGKGDGFTLVKEDNSKSGNILLYDSVIVSGKNISEGMIVTDYK